MAKIEKALDQAGADGYVCKPFTTDALKQKLTRSDRIVGMVVRMRRVQFGSTVEYWFDA